MAKLKPQDDPERTTPRGLIRYSSEFFACALAADDAHGTKREYEIVPPVPVLFMIGQSLELALKAYLLFHQVPLTKLKLKYGHALHKSLRKAKELGILNVVPISADDEQIISLLDNLYSSKQLQYCITGARTYPTFGPLEQVTREILEGVARHVEYPPNRLPHAP